ncbi:MAG: TolC family protein, partial [Nitrospirota bacterium]
MNRRSKTIASTLSVMSLLFILSMPVLLSAAEAVSSGQTGTVAGQSDDKERSTGGLIAKDEILTLSRCIDIALRQNQNIAASVSTVEVNRSRVGEARSNYYPQLSAQAAYNRISPMTGSLAATGLVSGSQSYEQYSSSVTLNQNILDFGKTSSQVNISKFNLESSRSDLSTTQDSIILSVKQAYYGV